MSVRQQAKQLFEYISHVYAIDLPVTRDVTAYRAELWWQTDLMPCSQCAVREFDTASSENDQGGEGALTQPEPWLSVLKRPIEKPPQPPAEIKDWLTLVPNPEKPPQPKPSILKREKFSDSKARVETFRTFAASWKSALPSDRPRTTPVPALLGGWVDTNGNGDDVAPMTERETEERFQDDPRRVSTLTEYLEGQWRKWADRVTPFFRTNVLYDQLYALHQRLSVEGDRIEILWGHLLLAWDRGPNARVLHPLFLTPMNLVFDEKEDVPRRRIRLVPSSSQPTRIDLECLRDLEYPSKDKILEYARGIRPHRRRSVMRHRNGHPAGALRQRRAGVHAAGEGIPLRHGEYRGSSAKRADMGQGPLASPHPMLGHGNIAFRTRRHAMGASQPPGGCHAVHILSAKPRPAWRRGSGPS